MNIECEQCNKSYDSIEESILFGTSTNKVCFECLMSNYINIHENAKEANNDLDTGLDDENQTE